MSIQRRIIVFIFLPVIVFLWLFGWGLYWIEDENRSQRTMRGLDDGISVIVDLYEEAVIASQD